MVKFQSEKNRGAKSRVNGIEFPIGKKKSFKKRFGPTSGIISELDDNY